MEETKNPIEYLVNTETGEIVQEIYDGDKLRLSRQSQIEYLETHIVNFNKDKSFVKIYDDVVPLLEKYLTLAEFRFAICLIPHVSYEDSIIRETKDRYSKILNIRDLAEIHGYSYDYAKKTISALKRKGVIGKHETGSILANCSQKINTVYTVNPFIYFRGSDLITPVHSFYINSGWKELLEKEETKNVLSKF